MRLEECFRRPAAVPVEHDVLRRQTDIVGREQRPFQGGGQHTLDDFMRSIDRRRLTGDNQGVAVDAHRHGDILFDCREILIEFTKEPDVVVQAL
ncbi:MAG: hypothetical protein NVS9B12_07960 [Vulcanimicrobiaceae bacterium]